MINAKKSQMLFTKLQRTGQGVRRGKGGLEWSKYPSEQQHVVPRNYGG